ncbi:MAG: hypothetical protein KAJ78_05850 [Acidobacteria bacterium]|nr:hypothetical protein [Acidobacteriota bacterium]
MHQSCLNHRLCRPTWIGAAIVAVLLIGLAAPASAQLNKTQHADGWLLAAAHAPGLQGSIWRTDLWVRGQTYSGGTITLYFSKSGEDNSTAQGYDIDFGQPGNIVYIEDVVDHFLGIGGGAWVGAIRYEATVPVQVYARIYSISADGSASFGQLVEGIPTDDMTIPYTTDGFPGTREDQWMFAMKHTADGRFRVNIGVINPTAVTAECGVGIFTTEGDFPSGGDRYITVDVPPYSMVQLSDPFAEIDGGEWNTHVVRVETPTEGAGVFAYASVVDNVTNDAYFVRGVKLYGPDAK